MSAIRRARISSADRSFHAERSAVCSGPGRVDQGLQRAFGYLLGEEPGRVVGASRRPQRGLGHVQLARAGSPRGRRAGLGG